MNQKFQANVQQKDDVTYVKLAGVIDEDNELTNLTEKIPGGTVVIDLADIERINSCGVRDWVNWLTRVEKNGARVVLVECSPAIVAQINLVNNFTGGGVVKSFFAPYFCPNCDREKVLLVETSDMGAAPHKAPTCRCDECDGTMDFDDMEDSYFAFLGTAKKVADAAKIQAAVADMNPANEDKSKIRSRGSQVSGVGLGATASSLPSVPSLPSIARTATGTGTGAHASFGGGASFAGGASRPGTIPGKVGFGGSTRPGTNPGLAGTDPGSLTPPPASHAQPPVSQPRSGKMLYILVGAILVIIVVLLLLLLNNNSSKKADRDAAHPAVATLPTSDAPRA